MVPSPSFLFLSFFTMKSYTLLATFHPRLFLALATPIAGTIESQIADSLYPHIDFALGFSIDLVLLLSIPALVSLFSVLLSVFAHLLPSPFSLFALSMLFPPLSVVFDLSQFSFAFFLFPFFFLLLWR
jgi:hypothetical protein